MAFFNVNKEHVSSDLCFIPEGKEHLFKILSVMFDIIRMKMISDFFVFPEI